MAIDFNYNIKLTKLIGAEGMGLVQMATSILMVPLIIAIGGFPTAVSKLVARAGVQKYKYSPNNILNMGIFIICTILGFLILCIVFLDDFIAQYIFKDGDMVEHIYLLIPAIILISLTSLFRGYYYGLDRVNIPNISQVLEAGTQLLFIYIMIYIFKTTDPYLGSKIALLAISVGESVNLLFLLLNRGRFKFKSRRGSRLKLFREIFTIGLPIGFANLLSMSSRFVSTILIPRQLIKIGLSRSQATEILGRIMGMAMPLITLPFMVTSALGVIIIPNLAGEMALKNYHKVKEQIIFSIRITLLFALPLGFLYIIFPNYLGQFLYNDLELGKFIRIMSFNTVFISLQNITSNILQGFNKQFQVSINKLIGVLVQASTYILIAHPKIGINGFFLGFYLSSILVCTLNLLSLRNMVRLNISFKDIILKPLLSSGAMIGYMRFFLNTRLQIVYKPAFIMAILFGVFVYLLSLYILKPI